MNIFTLLQAAPSPTPAEGSSAFFRSLEANRDGILVLLLILFVLGVLVHWIAWITASGRFKPPETPLVTPRQNLRYLVAEVGAKIIDEFRHLLALIIVVIFALALAFVLIQARLSIEGMKEGLQSVVATLGGLVGSLIGYYFGEASGERTASAPSPPGAPPTAVQGASPAQGGTEGAIIAAPPPPEGVLNPDVQTPGEEGQQDE
jgi:hypothetical protein